MAKKRKNNSTSMSATSKLLMLGAIVLIPAIFIAVATGTSLLADVAPFALLGVFIVASTIYSGMTTKLLYDFYDLESPWYRFIPCYGELTLMDSKFLRAGTVAYIFVILFFGISMIPYKFFKVLGETLAISMPFYATILMFIAIGVLSIIKGIGYIDTMRTVNAEWEEKMDTSVGFLRAFVWLGFIPFIRVLCAYAINKPLSSLVTFYGMTADEEDEVVLSEEN